MKDERMNGGWRQRACLQCLPLSLANVFFERLCRGKRGKQSQNRRVDRVVALAAPGASAELTRYAMKNSALLVRGRSLSFSFGSIRDTVGNMEPSLFVAVNLYLCSWSLYRIQIGDNARLQNKSCKANATTLKKQRGSFFFKACLFPPAGAYCCSSWQCRRWCGERVRTPYSDAGGSMGGRRGYRMGAMLIPPGS